MCLFSELGVYSLTIQTFTFSCPPFSTFHLLLYAHIYNTVPVECWDGIISTILLSLLLLTSQWWWWKGWFATWKMVYVGTTLKKVSGSEIYVSVLTLLANFSSAFWAADCQKLGQFTEERITQSFLLWLLYFFTWQILAGVGDRILS